ncbi:MAG TPA: FHA domain-containing protein [Aggregatilineaceae bacterium]|nr:FHA domain-containing protein [Anaerolineae bacterium]HMM28994.1 FHA domain-containing protein [Aggregatilineaceae bacterium]
MGTLIVLVVALGALGALLAGAVLLYFYFRTGREEGYDDEPLTYGNLVQCPACGTMNPTEAAACLSCRRPLPHARATLPPPAPVIHPPAPSAQAPYQPAPPRANPPARVAPPARPPAPSPAPAVALSRERPADMPLAWLEGRGGAAVGHRDVIRYADVLVGRSTACDVRVADPKVSRRHFLVRYANGQFFMQDQQSSRGTKVNGERVMARRLDDGDTIAFGDSLMVFRVDRPNAANGASGENGA